MGTRWGLFMPVHHFIWDTVNVWPAMVIVALRVPLPLYDATVTATEPVPPSLSKFCDEGLIA